MKQRSNLICPNCESQLERETCPRSEGWSPEWKDYKELRCPCCMFFLTNESKPCVGWKELETIAVSRGAKRMEDLTIALNLKLFDQIERFLESKLPDPDAAAILQELEAAEIERTTQALRERFVISEPSPTYLSTDGLTHD